MKQYLLLINLIIAFYSCNNSANTSQSNNKTIIRCEKDSFVMQHDTLLADYKIICEKNFIDERTDEHGTSFSYEVRGQLVIVFNRQKNLLLIYKDGDIWKKITDVVGYRSLLGICKCVEGTFQPVRFDKPNFEFSNNHKVRISAEGETKYLKIEGIELNHTFTTYIQDQELKSNYLGFGE
jgi:hypothetical protein